MAKRPAHIESIFTAADSAFAYAESIRTSPDHSMQDVAEAVNLAHSLARTAMRLDQKEAHRVAFITYPSR